MVIKHAYRLLTVRTDQAKRRAVRPKTIAPITTMATVRGVMSGTLAMTLVSYWVPRKSDVK